MISPNLIKNCPIEISNENFVIIKSKKPLKEAFANIIDKKEITAIIEDSEYNKKNVIEIQKGFKLLTFNAILPFDLVGFIAKVSKELADEGISIFVISSYSTDHLLIKDKDLEKAVNKLKSIGFEIRKLQNGQKKSN